MAMTKSCFRALISFAILAAVLGGGGGDSRAGDHVAFADIKEGKRTFSVHCSHCHGPFGHGLFGPSLVDRETLNGNTFDDTLRVISDGVPNTAMRSWARNFNEQRLQDVATFVFSIYGTVAEDPPAAER
jgi:cytochrome c oxidase cbb3-type subunit III